MKTKSTPHVLAKATRTANSVAEVPSSDWLAAAKNHAETPGTSTRPGPSARRNCRRMGRRPRPVHDVGGDLQGPPRRHGVEALSLRRRCHLQPDHSEAMLHLMLLYEQEGAHAQAGLLRGRLQPAAEVLHERCVTGCRSID